MGKDFITMKLTKQTFYKLYYKSKIKELLANPKLFFFYLGRLRKYQQTENFDLLLVSYPKSGRTWLQNVFVEIGKIGYDPQGELESSTPIAEALTSLGENDTEFPKILATHAKSSWEQIEGLLDAEEVKADDLKEYKSSKIVFLYRDPRDVLVSQYYHIKFRNRVDQITKDDLLQNPIIGVNKIISFMNKWRRYADTYPNRIHMVSYESMKKDSKSELIKLWNFLGLTVNEAAITEAIERSELKKMQKKQAASTNKDPWTKTNDAKNLNSYQSRKGIVGEYEEFFTDAQIDKLNLIIKTKLNLDFGYS